MAAIRYFQSGDYQNTVLRKMLENEGQVIAGVQTISIRTAGGSVSPQFPKIGDSRNDLCRKILQNQTGALAGTMTMHIR